MKYDALIWALNCFLTKIHSKERKGRAVDDRLQKNTTSHDGNSRSAPPGKIKIAAAMRKLLEKKFLSDYWNNI